VRPPTDYASTILDIVCLVTIRTAEPDAIKGVIFDFHATLVDTRDTDQWISAAQQRLGHPARDVPTPAAAQIEGLTEYLGRIWEHANTIDPHSARDLSQVQHRDVFRQTVGLLPHVQPDLIDALYAVMADQWIAFDDTLPVLQELKARGIKIVVLSNIGIDIRGCLAQAGLTDLIDGLVLSYEVGVVKPDPEIFRLATNLLGLSAEQTLMVGDSWRDDAGAAAIGIRTLILPRTVGPVHGLASVLRLVG
jgi:FMN phosphatase YigB (HAD superfamily)